jgi:hypothetical protein
METLFLPQIRIDGGTQARASMSESVIDEYAAALIDGAVVPPVIVFFDGADYWLADGFHRHGAHVKACRSEIACEVREGTRRDAVLFSVGANASHGLRRTNEDKQNAVMVMLNDPEWSNWSNREIGRQCAVDHKTVARMRMVTGEVPTERKFTTRHGTVSTMTISPRPITGEVPTEPTRSVVDEVAGHASKILELVADVDAAILAQVRKIVRSLDVKLTKGIAR